MDPVPEFSVTRRRAGEAVVVVPVGELDLATVDVLAGELEAARGEAARVVLDLRELAFIDSAGVRLMLESSKLGSFAVVRGPREIQRVFDLVGLDERRLTMLDQPPDE